MSRHYSDPAREVEPYALPDVEVFHVAAGEWYVEDDDGERIDPSEVERGISLSGEAVEPCAAGFYFWFCLPGCMPDSEPRGPYDSEQAALDAARELAGGD